MTDVLQQWWTDLRAHVIPPDASEAQVRDMRVAFLSGISDLMKFIGSLEPTEANREVLARLTADVDAGIVAILESLPKGPTNRTETRKVADLLANDRESPLPLSVIPNYMGINLCAVDAISWVRQPDRQLVSLTIHFIPAKDGPS